MNQDANPYRSPGPRPESAEVPLPDDSLVRRGQRMYLGIVIFLFVLELAPPFLLGTEPAIESGLW